MASPSIHNNHIIILTISYKSWYYLKNKIAKTNARWWQWYEDDDGHSEDTKWFSSTQFSSGLSLKSLFIWLIFFFVSVPSAKKFSWRSFEHNFGEWDGIVRAGDCVWCGFQYEQRTNASLLFPTVMSFEFKRNTKNQTKHWPTRNSQRVPPVPRLQTFCLVCSSAKARRQKFCFYSMFISVYSSHTTFQSRNHVVRDP